LISRTNTAPEGVWTLARLGGDDDAGRKTVNPDGHARSIGRKQCSSFAISLLAGTLNSALPFSMAAASSVASTLPSHWAFAAIL
jgi:hypothetical protein